MSTMAVITRSMPSPRRRGRAARRLVGGRARRGGRDASPRRPLVEPTASRRRGRPTRARGELGARAGAGRRAGQRARRARPSARPASRASAGPSRSPRRGGRHAARRRARRLGAWRAGPRRRASGRRRAGARRAAGEPAVPDADDLPAAVAVGAGRRPARATRPAAPSRCRAAAARTRAASRSRTHRGVLVPLVVGQQAVIRARSGARRRSRASPPSGRRPPSATRRRTRRRVCAPVHGAPQRPISASAQAEPRPRGRQPLGALAQRHRPRARAATAASAAEPSRRTGRGSAAPSSRTSRDDRQPGERLVGQLDPQRPLGVARAAVVARLVLGDQPQLADLGLEGGGADDGRRPARRCATISAIRRALLAGGEVAADPAADGRATCRRRAARPLAVLEEVDARARAGRASARCRLRRWARVDPAGVARQLLEGVRPRAGRPARSSPCSTSTVARASSSARWSGVVVARKSCASVASLRLGTSSRVSSRRARCGGVDHRRTRGQACPVRGAGGLEEADVERRVVRDEHGAAGELEERRQDRVDARGAGDHRVGDAGEHADERRDRLGPGRPGSGTRRAPRRRGP